MTTTAGPYDRQTRFPPGRRADTKAGAKAALAMLVPKAEQDSPPRSPPAGASHDRLLDHA
jgi:hypothetical protein